MNVASETVAIIGVADGQPTLAAWALAEAQDTGAVLIFRLGRRARYAGTYDLSLCVACCSRMHGVCAMLCGGVRFYTCTGSHIPSQASCGCAGSCPVFRITARFAEGSALQGPRAEEQGGTPHQ